MLYCWYRHDCIEDECRDHGGEARRTDGGDHQEQFPMAAIDDDHTDD